MIKYGMCLKSGLDIIHLTYQQNKEQAKQYFAKVKKMPLKEFNKLFIVKEIKNNGGKN